jgi:PD-(D/E)XK nuclease superfamily
MNENPKIKYTWSYSSLDLYKQCPHKYYRLRVKKDVVDPNSDQKNYGTEFHLSAEEFIRDGKPLPKKFEFAYEPLELLRKRKGKHLCENKLGLTRSLQPCDFFSKDVWWRGIVDLIILQDDVAYVVDYKTGRTSKYADTKQLEIMSLAVFKHYPQIKKIKAGLLFVVANDFIKADYEQKDSAIYWQGWIENTNRLEKSIELDVWNPRPNFTCKSWCPVKDCAHNGKGYYK